MSYLLIGVALAFAATAPLPSEVEAFVVQRELCEHFRSEPIEGDASEQRKRRAFVQESIEIHCAGTDRRLAALRRRYAYDAAVMSALAKYEPDIEGTPCIR